MCTLYQKSKSSISEYLTDIFKKEELDEDAVVRKFRTTAADGKMYNTRFYNLDVIISVGYRADSHRGIQFRKWATQRLKSGNLLNYFVKNTHKCGKKRYLCINSTRHATQRTAYQGESFAFKNKILQFRIDITL